jgi:hypothetical protein
MAEDSAMHQGSSIGHAATTDVWGAPYSANEYADIYSKLLGSNAAKGYVLPSYNNDLKIQANSPAAMNVIVKSGAASVRGRIYENTSDVTITIATADVTDPRIDRIVLRYTDSLQTIELAVVAGTAAATPSLPALTQTAAIYEVDIAYVWVAASAVSIADTEIHDVRVFAPNFEALLNVFGQHNLIQNSEFMAISAIGATTAPDRWDTVSSGPTLTLVTKPSQMSRGRAVRMTAGGAGRGMSQTFHVKASTMYTIKVLIQVTAGDVGNFSVTTNAAAPATISRNIRRTGSYIEHTIYYSTEADATLMTVSFTCVNNTDVVDVGQALAQVGYFAGPYRPFRETIMYSAPLTDSSWTATAKSTGSTSAILTSTFQSTIMAGTRAVIAKIEANDSGSAASTAEFAIRDADATVSDATRIYLRGVPNDIKRAQQCTVSLPTIGITTNPSVQFDVVASGVGTLDATAQILGIMI